MSCGSMGECHGGRSETVLASNMLSVHEVDCTLSNHALRGRKPARKLASCFETTGRLCPCTHETQIHDETRVAFFSLEYESDHKNPSVLRDLHISTVCLSHLPLLDLLAFHRSTTQSPPLLHATTCPERSIILEIRPRTAPCCPRHGV
ncbi:hypothetical protein Mapa_006563 [Marchantia paleacea]|nr:hypothetical protein Mapa_006563 [Marchantia paleacea]